MKLAFNIIVLGLALGLTACKKAPEKAAAPAAPVAAPAATPAPAATAPTAANPVEPASPVVSNAANFDWSKIPEATSNIGAFPYLNAPETYTYEYKKEINPKNISDFDKEYFAVNGKLIIQEGKSFKTRLEKDKADGKSFNSSIVEKSYEEAILALGGVKVNAVTVSNDEVKRVGDKELIGKHYGYSIDQNSLDEIKTYVIKKGDKKIWIQLGLGRESSKLAILETGSLKTVKIESMAEFPYLKAPVNYSYGYKNEINPSNISDFDKEYFAENGKLVVKEGKSFKVSLEKDKTDGKYFNSLVVESSYDEAIKALGGEKVNNVPVSNDEIKRVGDKELIQKRYGYSINQNRLEDIKTYLIKKNDKEVWIQLAMSGESSNLTILETGSLKTLKVATITAEGMKKEIDATGKAIVNINFDTDKATLKADGQEVVNQIAALLKAAPVLKLSIEGHTDNTGSAERNKVLSTERSNAVMLALVNTGISKDNLKAAGFGADRPLVANDSEENKAKNRRVELVKF
jgi:OmpA-OmpF porin, OOP family